jgi:hypothetical protein
VDARFDPTPPADRGVIDLDDAYALGSEASDQVILEFDLSAYMDFLNNPSALQQALLSLDYSTAFAGITSQQNLIPLGNTLFFTAQQPLPAAVSSPRAAAPIPALSTRTSNTILGTFLLKDIIANSTSSVPQQFTTVGSTMFFSARSDARPGLYKAMAQPALLWFETSISASYTNSSIRQAWRVNGTLFFTADDGASGIRLFSNNGTFAGRSGWSRSGRPANWLPTELTNFNGVLYFAANDGTNGEELRRTVARSAALLWS